MMATILSQTSNVPPASVTNANNSPPSTPINTDKANKRNRQNDTIHEKISPITTAQEQFNRMEVEETFEAETAVTGQQNHDVQKERGSPLIH
jgi:vesicle coat complex subunit